MTERSPARVKKSDDAKPQRKSAPGGAQAAEIARLNGELETAQARIAELEKRQADILNRIDWVIDSLHNVSD